MRQLQILIGVAIAVAVSLQLASGQLARNTIPDTVTACYLNTTAYNRFSRQPMHINNLIAIIRKIEKKTFNQWDSRRIARTLVHRFMFDGMEYHGHAKPDLVFSQKSEEAIKTDIIKSLIPIPVEEIFPDILDNDEKCALHWMLSHSMNATMRDEELSPGFGYPGTGGGGSYNPGYGQNGNNNNNNNQGSGNNWSGGSYGGNSGSGFNGGSSGSGMNGNGNGMYGGSNSGSGNYQYSGRKRRDATEGQGNWNMSDENHESGNGHDSDIMKSSEEDGNMDSNGKVPHDDVEHLPNFNAASTSKSGRQQALVQDYKKKTKNPIETGIVHTNWGPVAAGRVIAGIAAGLEPLTMSANGGVAYRPEPSTGGNNPWSGGSGISNPQPWNNQGGNNGNGPWKSGAGGQPPYQGQPQYPPNQNQQSGWGRRKRQIDGTVVVPIESLYAVTLAGDAGQAAIKNGQNKDMGNAVVPSGVFNDTVCPREYVLSGHADPSKEIYLPAHAWTYMTEAEVRGGLDGLILGSIIKRIDPSSNQPLSEILSQYYSEAGVAADPRYRSCDRSSLLSSAVEGNKLYEQTLSFAVLYNNRTKEISKETLLSRPGLLQEIVTEAYGKMNQVASSFSNTGPSCTRPVSSSADMSDDRKEVVPRLTVYGVLDHSASPQDIDQQKRFLGKLAYDLNVSPAGSRLGVVDGSAGTVLISPNWTDTSSILACRILSLHSIVKSQDYVKVMSSMKSELEKVRNDEIRYNYTSQNGVVILLMVQGKRLEANQRTEIIKIRDEIEQIYGGVSVVATSSKHQESDFEGLTFIKLNTGAQNFSDLADEFATGLLKKTHGALRYLHCNGEQYNQDNEHIEGTTVYVNPGSFEYFKISPEYFYRGRSLVFRFTSDNGRVRVCISRKEWYPKEDKDGRVRCKDTSGNYVVPGQSTVDVEFRDELLHQPCGKKGEREDCDPIFVSITPIKFNSPGEPGLDCSVEPCQSPNQVKVTFTHSGMRCNGAIRTMFSSSIAFIAILITLMNWISAT